MGYLFWQNSLVTKSNNNSTIKNSALDKVTNENVPTQGDQPLNKTDQLQTQTPETKPIKTFTFVSDTSNWVRITSIDKSYSVALGPNVTTGFCNGDTTTILLGMIYLNQTNRYDCNSVISALNRTNPLLARHALGLLESNENLTDKDSIIVNLPNGVTAKYYEYTTTESDISYNNIQYVIDHDGISYTAHMRWPIDYNIYEGSNILPSTFDTIIQKTWQFN
jgi:hypothetical protein